MKRSTKKKLLLLLNCFTLVLVITLVIFHIRTYEQLKADREPSFTYELMDSAGWGIPGAYCTDSNHGHNDSATDLTKVAVYCIDEAAIFGPFDCVPHLEFCIDGFEQSLTTDGLWLNRHYVDDHMWYSAEEEYQIDDNAIISLLAVMYEDGEVYVAVKFYKVAYDSLGEVMTLKTRWELSGEDEARYREMIRSEVVDYFLMWVPDGTSISLKYETDSLAVIGLRLENLWPYDFAF